MAFFGHFKFERLECRLSYQFQVVRKRYSIGQQESVKVMVSCQIQKDLALSGRSPRSMSFFLLLAASCLVACSEPVQKEALHDDDAFHCLAGYTPEDMATLWLEALGGDTQQIKAKDVRLWRNRFVLNTNQSLRDRLAVNEWYQLRSDVIHISTQFQRMVLNYSSNLPRTTTLTLNIDIAEQKQGYMSDRKPPSRCFVVFFENQLLSSRGFQSLRINYDLGAVDSTLRTDVSTCLTAAVLDYFGYQGVSELDEVSLTAPTDVGPIELSEFSKWLIRLRFDPKAISMLETHSTYNYFEKGCRQ